MLCLLISAAPGEASWANDCANFIPPKVGPYSLDTITADIEAWALVPYVNGVGFTMDAFSLYGITNGESRIAYFSPAELDAGCVLAGSTWVCGPHTHKMASYVARLDSERVHDTFYYGDQVSTNNQLSCIVHLDWTSPTLNPCSLFGICTKNTITYCWGLSGTQVGVPAAQCYIAGLVNPMACSCQTRLISGNKTPEEIAHHQKMVRIWTNTANLAGIGATWTSVLSLSRVLKLVAGTAALIALREQAIVRDPPDPDFTLVAAPYCQSWVPVAGAADLTPAEAGALDAWQQNQACLAGSTDAAATAMERWSAAVSVASPVYEQIQRDAFNAAIAVAQGYMATEVTIRQGFLGPTWNASKKNPKVVDLHQYLAPYTNSTDLADLSDAAAANLQMAP